MTSRRRISRRKVIAGLFAPLIGVLAEVPDVFASRAAEKLISEAANKVISIANAGGSRTGFEAALTRYVAVERMALFALGKHRKKLPSGDRDRYVRLVKEMMVNALTKHAGRIRGRRFVVTGSTGILVKGHVEHRPSGKTKVEWRVQRGRITDIRIQGIWLAIALREAFTGIIDDANGDFGALLAFLQTGQVPD